MMWQRCCSPSSGLEYYLPGGSIYSITRRLRMTKFIYRNNSQTGSLKRFGTARFPAAIGK